MRAVNLIPQEERRGGGTPGRSGGAVYALLGALAVLVVAVSAYVLTSNSVKDKEAELAKVRNETAAAEAQAAALKPYREFAALKQIRATTVTSLALSRFDWERVMRQLAIVLPDDVWLTSVVGTVAPGVAFSGGSGGTGGAGSLRSSVQAPAIELVGCTVNQAEVSRVMVRLREMDGVTRVSLGSSEKNVNASGGTGGSAGTGASSGGSGGTGGDCRQGSSKYPQFQMVVFFRPLPGASARGAGGSAASASTAAQTPPSSAQKAQGAGSTSGGSR